jgi:hypothetical protein
MVDQLERNIILWIHGLRENTLAPVVMTDAVTTEYNARFGDYVRANPTAAGFAVFLPEPTQGARGQSVTVKNDSASANAITAKTHAGALLDGAATHAIAGARRCARYVCTGDSYIVEVLS